MYVYATALYHMMHEAAITMTVISSVHVHWLKLYIIIILYDM